MLAKLKLLPGLLLVMACVKPPPVSTVPEITYKSLSTNFVTQCVDSLKVVFEFKDGDGDLGYPKSDSTTDVFLKDSRTNMTLDYSFPDITPTARNKAVQGEVTITVAPCVLLCRGIPIGRISDTLYFDIYIKDRAGNKSNTIKTSDIIIDCP